jgi:SagB-type dehydrogenase family enzyme
LPQPLEDSDPPTTSARLRRSPHLVSYWRNGDLIFENYAIGVRTVGHPLTCEVLDFFDDWRSAQEFLDAHAEWDRSTTATLLEAFVQHALLQRDGQRRSPREDAMDAWAPWNPAAGFFHTATKDVPFDDLENAPERSREARMPAAVKRIANAEHIALPKPRVRGVFARVLLERRTWRRFSNESIDLTAFSTLLGLTAGIQRWAYAEGEGKVALKTSPSGGARHAIEVYPLVRRVAGLRPGLYHYAADLHALELIDGDVDRLVPERYLPTQWWFNTAGALVFFASLFSRELWRYAYARAYRAVLIEAGHMCQTFCLAATNLGLAPFCSMALADSAIESALRLDGVSESVLYAAGVGTRPRAARWAASNNVAGNPTPLTREAVRAFPGSLPRRRNHKR